MLQIKLRQVVLGCEVLLSSMNNNATMKNSSRPACPACPMAATIGYHLTSQNRLPGACSVALTYWMGSRLGSQSCFPGTSQATYRMVGHLGRQTRSPGACKMAYHPVRHFASPFHLPGICKVAYHPVRHFASHYNPKALPT